MWRRIAFVFARAEVLGLTPARLCEARQAHIPKAGKKTREDGALEASAMRPITVLSCLWRTWGSARLQQKQTAEWVKKWMPDEAYGGKKGADALSALIPILEDAAEGRFVGTYDYSLAFDYTDPKIACWLVKKLGMPEGTAELLQ